MTLSPDVAARIKRLSQIERNVLTLRGRGYAFTAIAGELGDGLTAERIEEMLVEIRFKLDGVGPDPSFDYLLDVAAREHQACIAKGQEMIEHAIAAGDLLLRAKEKVPFGEQGYWLEDLAVPASTARAYMRVAKHRGQVREAGVATIKGALEALRGQARVDPRVTHHIQRVAADAPEDAPRAEIARRAGVSPGRVDRALDPDGQREARQRSEDELARQREKKERDRQDAVMAAGGGLAEAWVSVANALEQIDDAIAELPHARRHLKVAGDRLRMVMDNLAYVATAEAA